MITSDGDKLQVFDLESKSWIAGAPKEIEMGSKTISFAGSFIAVNVMNENLEWYLTYFNWKTYKYEKLTVRPKFTSRVVAVLAIENSLAQCNSSEIK